MSMSDVRLLLGKIEELRERAEARLGAIEEAVAALQDRVEGKDVMDEVLGPPATPSAKKARAA